LGLQGIPPACRIPQDSGGFGYKSIARYPYGQTAVHIGYAVLSGRFFCGINCRFTRIGFRRFPQKVLEPTLRGGFPLSYPLTRSPPLSGSWLVSPGYVFRSDGHSVFKVRYSNHHLSFGRLANIVYRNSDIR
jgi:hypothetical protein